MITNLLFTALCLAIAFVVTLDTHASRPVSRVRVSTRDRDRRSGQVLRD